MSSSEDKELLMNYLNNRSTNYDYFKSVFEQAKKNTDSLTTGRAAIVFIGYRALKSVENQMYIFDEIMKI